MKNCGAFIRSLYFSIFKKNSCEKNKELHSHRRPLAIEAILVMVLLVNSYQITYVTWTLISILLKDAQHWHLIYPLFIVLFALVYSVGICALVFYHNITLSEFISIFTKYFQTSDVLYHYSGGSLNLASNQCLYSFKKMAPERLQGVSILATMS